MTRWTLALAGATAAATTALFTSAELAQNGQVNVICSVQADWCNLIQRQYQLPSNKNAVVDANVLDFKKIKLNNDDHAKYGASAERKRLISRWEKDVNSLPR